MFYDIGIQNIVKLWTHTIDVDHHGGEYICFILWTTEKNSNLYSRTVGEVRISRESYLDSSRVLFSNKQTH